jgi:single-stranded-DNA-specific exonuclease
LPPPLAKAEATCCHELAAALQLPPLMAEILFQRGFTNAEAAQFFLFPRLTDLPSPLFMKGMAEAAELIAHAAATQQQVIIHGDYDVDGISSAVLLADFLRKLGLETSCHLPNRLTDEYGLTMQSAALLAEQATMPALLITVDCGISSPEEVRYAKDLGFTVIVTDHHEPRSSAALPAADAVINPKQPGCAFPCKELAGAGVVFFLCMAVRRKMVEQGFWTEANMPNLRDALDLAALGTVADVMPLTGLNRILVRAGLEVIAEQRRPGLRALCERANLQEGAVSAENIAYQLAPRINAAGRLGKPELAANLLLAQDAGKAAELAADLEAANLLRRDMEAAVLEQAIVQADQQLAAKQGCVLISGQDWHPGLIGIIAARMIDRYQLPALVFTADSGQEGMLKGSGRSVPGLNLHQVLEQCQAQIVRFGGHAMAAGLTVRQEEFEQFCAAFSRTVQEAQCTVPPQTVAIDAVLDERTNWHELTQSLQLMEPFGQANPEPVFLLRNVRLREVSTLREHLRFAVPVNGGLIKGIGFFMADQLETALEPIDLCLKVKLTSFRGRRRLEVHAVALRAAE